MTAAVTELDNLLGAIRACRQCVENPHGKTLPHEPRPVLRATSTARLAVCGQAPGTRVHASGTPFTDPSGDRLRAWMSVTEEEFYDESRLAIVPMGFCFPGQDAHGGRSSATARVRRSVAPSTIRCIAADRARAGVGAYAQDFHLGASRGKTLQETMLRWREHLKTKRRPRVLPLPHPSWRNNAWLTRNPWFEVELLPVLRREVRRLL